MISSVGVDKPSNNINSNYSNNNKLSRKTVSSYKLLRALAAHSKPYRHICCFNKLYQKETKLLHKIIHKNSDTVRQKGTPIKFVNINQTHQSSKVQ